MEALEGIDGLGVAQGPPLVPLHAVGFGQHFQLFCDVGVVVGRLLARRLCTDPLTQALRGWAGLPVSLSGDGVSATDQGFQISCANLGLFPVTASIVRAGLEVRKENRQQTRERAPKVGLESPGQTQELG